MNRLRTPDTMCASCFRLDADVTCCANRGCTNTVHSHREYDCSEGCIACNRTVCPECRRVVGEEVHCPACAAVAVAEMEEAYMEACAL